MVFGGGGGEEGWNKIVDRLWQGGSKKLNTILSACSGLQEALEEKRKKQKEERLDRLFRLNEQHCNLAPIYGTEVLRFCTLFPPAPPPAQEKEEEVMVEASEERAMVTQKVEPKGSRGSGYTHCYAAQLQRGAQHLEAYWQRSETLAQAVLTPQQRIEELTDIIER